ncbi:MAG: hypothetical protein JWQ69_2249 [Pseudomonas sp.]|nr:hypothetical protein [Pseudomonas sp.]
MGVEQYPMSALGYPDCADFEDAVRRQASSHSGHVSGHKIVPDINPVGAGLPAKAADQAQKVLDVPNI